MFAEKDREKFSFQRLGKIIFAGTKNSGRGVDAQPK